ncbi:MAG: hypothetical protein WBF93_04490 [Pirellulales bacterium]
MTNPYESSQDIQEALPQGASRRGFRFMISGALLALCGFTLLGLIIAIVGFPEKPWPQRLRAVFHFDADFLLPLALVMLVGAGIGAVVAFFTKGRCKPVA